MNFFKQFQDQVKCQDSVFVIAGVTSSVLGREETWNFVKQNWTLLYERFTGGHLLPRLIKVYCVWVSCVKCWCHVSNVGIMCQMLMCCQGVSGSVICQELSCVKC